MKENNAKNTFGPNEFTDVRPAVNRQPGFRRVDSQSGYKPANDRYQTRKAIAHKRNAHGLKRTCNSNHAKQMRTNATTEQMNTKKKQSITQINVFHCIAVRFQPAPAEAVQFAHTKTYKN